MLTGFLFVIGAFAALLLLSLMATAFFWKFLVPVVVLAFYLLIQGDVSDSWIVLAFLIIYLLLVFGFDIIEWFECDFRIWVQNMKRKYKKEDSGK